MSKQTLVLKKLSPNGKLMMYLSSRIFSSSTDPIDGIIMVDVPYLNHRQVYGQLVAHFQFGREKDETMGLKFFKTFILSCKQLYPSISPIENLTLTQKSLLEKKNCKWMYPFIFHFPNEVPASVTLLTKLEDEPKKACGIHYYIIIYVAENASDIPCKRSSVKLNIQKVHYASAELIRNLPLIAAEKHFSMCFGNIELESTLDKSLFQYSERIPVNISIQNNSNKIVKKIRVTLFQNVNIKMLQNIEYKRVVDEHTSIKECPLLPGSSLQTIIHVMLKLNKKQMKRGLALSGHHKREEYELASSTFLHNDPIKDAFGITVNYFIRVQLSLGKLRKYICINLPVLLSPLKVNKES